LAFAEYEEHDAIGLAELVRRGEVTASELVEEALARIERRNPAIGAVVHRMDDRAREAAQGFDAGGPDAARRQGALAGVPMLLKDLMADHEGVPTTSGSRFLEGTVASADSELVRRYKGAGLLPVGKTNACELGLLPTTEPLCYGPTRNPWNLEHSAGGSSGGSAAAVAAGIVPLAHANDGGGSIRIPASCCGLVGLKPTRARNPLGPNVGDVMSGLVCEHVVTRSVRDSAAVLDATAGPDLGDPYWAPPPPRPFLDEVGRDPGRLRIAFWPRTLDGAPIHPECAAAAESAARLCAGLGHEVEEAKIPLSQDALSQAFMAIWASGCTATIDGLALVTGREVREDRFEPLTWAMYRIGSTITAAQYQLAVGALQRAAREIAGFFERYDIWLTSTLGAPPLPLGVIDGNESDAVKAFEPLFGYVPYTAVCNGTGQPAISLPLHWSEAGLPIGVQLAGRFGDEGLLLCLAAQLEAERPWFDRRPPALG